MTMRPKLKIVIPFLAIILPLLMYLVWLLRENCELRILILDKTVLDKSGLEHRSVNWVLTHEKWVKPNGELYLVEKDYRGFFPLVQPDYEIHDLNGLSNEQIDSLAAAVNVVYVTDAYGIYYNEWYLEREQTERSSLVYGGLSPMDLRLLQKVREQGKLIITEFNTFGSPTGNQVRRGCEELLDLEWTGWNARYFDMLDTLKNPELPRWVYRLYRAQHNNAWPFTKSGIVFVHAGGAIEILENESDLADELPYLETNSESCKRFGVPEKIAYPYWLDIVKAGSSNRVLAEFQLYTTLRGDSLLKRAGIPKRFPAVLERSTAATTYYFAGDFADNPVSIRLAKFYGISWFKPLFYSNKLTDRRRFFWLYFRPLLTQILKEKTG